MSAKGAQLHDESGNVPTKGGGGNSISADWDSDCCHRKEEDQLVLAKSPTRKDRQGSDDVPSLQRKSCRRKPRWCTLEQLQKTSGKQFGDTVETPKSERNLGHSTKMQHQPKNNRKSFTSDVHITSTQDAQKGLPTSGVKSKKMKKLREAIEREYRRTEAVLPMYEKKNEIVQLITENQVCVILGETGSGKSTQMTQYLYEAGFAEKGLIVCTQPRKVAATTLASHVAREMGNTVGKVVGCRVGGNVQASKEMTGIVYVTDHILLN